MKILNGRIDPTIRHSPKYVESNSILKALSDHIRVSVEKQEEEYCVIENQLGDAAFALTLTKDQLILFADEIRALAGKMKDSNRGEPWQE